MPDIATAVTNGVYARVSTVLLHTPDGWLAAGLAHPATACLPTSAAKRMRPT